MKKIIVFALNRFPMRALKAITESMPLLLEVNNGRITDYKRIKNPHADC